jgi:hypothetical protein
MFGLYEAIKFNTLQTTTLKDILLRILALTNTSLNGKVKDSKIFTVNKIVFHLFVDELYLFR